MSIEISPYETIENRQFGIHEKIIIDDSIFDSIEFRDGKITFSFENCFFRTLYIENRTNIDFKDISILFSYCYIENIYVEQIESENISVLFTNSIISGKIDNKNLGLVSIYNCLMNDSLFLMKLKKVDISYGETTINPSKWRKFLRQFSLSINDYKENRFYVYEFEKLTFYSEEDTTNKFGVFKENYKNYDYNKIRFRFTDQEKAEFKISLKLIYNPKIDDESTRILNSKFHSLEVSGTASGEVQIENCDIDNIYLHNFSTKESCNFYNIRPFRNSSDRKFEIKRSNLDKFWFDNVLFNSYQLISLYRNKISQTIFSSCEFPVNYKDFEKFIVVENIHYPEKKDYNYNKLRYETLLQLKKTLENSGNFQESLKFQSVANESLLKIENISNWDKVILSINSFSNDHGVSIKKPLIALFISSIFLYILYLISLNKIFIFKDSIDWKLFGYYFSFLDITHRTDFLASKKEGLNGFSLMIDYINKIILGFFIYQFIASFRKYGKK
ncbi:hypothetical protein [Chryseobacterium sp.]|uniref:hypothetical protein n=1 Tax=Chryseobacterium sp. TaxID=1871047 RepID=UPI0028988753|nr:hypothetical protein [Chryseobacterium sp.]